MALKIPVNKFVDFLVNRMLAKDGYIMGATGQNPKNLSSWYFNQYKNRDDYTVEDEKKALYWRENAKRVWDCNGLAEGYYKDITGMNIDTRARYNYANWCSVKAEGKVPNEHKVPGLAVFMGKTAKTITHVGYLVAPVDPSKPNGDWYVIEARGVQYGVVRTKLNSRNWKYWGYMDKYFDYSGHGDGIDLEELTKLGYRTLRKGDEGEDVKELQQLLKKWNPHVLLKYGADGDFGSETLAAVKMFQSQHKLTVDGIVGKQTLTVLEKYEEDEDEKVETAPTKTSKVVVTGGTVNVRSTNNTSGKILLVAKKDEEYEKVATKDNWHEIKTEKGNGWISGKYSKVVEG